MKRAAVTQLEELTDRQLDYGNQCLMTKKNKCLPTYTDKETEEISNLKQHFHTTVTNEPQVKVDGRRLNISFTVTNTFDIKRKQSLDDIRQILEQATESTDRFADIKFVIMCIIVSIDISAPRTPFEPTALCLAERVRAFLLREKITLSDEEQTQLNVNKDSISITLKDHPDDGLPIVGIGQAAFLFDVGDIVILQGTVISQPTVTSIQWFKVQEDGTEETIKIDNRKYLGGSRESPSLVIADSKLDDAGVYILEATNVNGTVRSLKSHLFMRDTRGEAEASDNDDDDDSADAGITTNGNVNSNSIHTSDVDSISAGSDTEDTTFMNNTTQNGYSSHNGTATSFAARVTATENGVMSPNASASSVDTTQNDVAPAPEAETDNTSDEDEEGILGSTMSNDVITRRDNTDRDSDDCSR